jgi:hypothetical protein
MKTKKLLSVLLVIVMTAMLLPFGSMVASADEPVYAEDTVALVNGVEVTAEDLVIALLSCPAGGTIDIVKDFTAFGLILSTYEDGTNCKWVVNGNGHTISSPLDALSNANYLITTTATYVEINDLTIKTMGSGIKVSDGSQVTLNNVNVYSGGTKEGTTLEAAQRESYIATQGSALQNSKCLSISASTRSNITINGGVYKAYGVAGVVLEVNRGNVVVNDGYFVGEDCNFVARVWNASRMTDLSNVTASLTVYGGTFIKPVVIKKTLQEKNDGSGSINGCSTGAVVRGDAGGLVNIHGGTFANFAGKVVDKEGKTILTSSNREYVVLSGTSAGNSASDIGFINIFGGDFYSFMTSDVTKDGPQVLGNQSVDLKATSETERVKINTNIYGGNFYSTDAVREDNITKIASEENNSLQHVPADQFTVTNTSGLTVNVYGKEFTGVTKWAFKYDQPTTAPAGATVKVENSNGNVYYLSDYNYSGTVSGTAVAVSIPAFVLAVNGIADNGATVTLLSDITIVPTEVLNRAQALTIDGAGNTITAATNGLTVSSGDITIKNVTISASTAAPVEGGAPAYALKIAKTAINEENVTVDSFKLDLKLENCTFNAYAPVVDNPFLQGSVATTNCTANGAALNIAHTYTAPTPIAPDLDGDDEGEDDGGDVPGGNTPTNPPIGGDVPGDNTPTNPPIGGDEPSGDTPSGDTPTTDTPATDNTPADDNKPEEKSGCGGAIGVGALTVLAVAGLACGFVAKKRDEE